MKFDFQKVLVVGLVAGCVLHPASSALGLLIVLAGQMGERYFTRNITDKDRHDISNLKTEVDRISGIQQKDGLAKAFTGRS